MSDFEIDTQLDERGEALWASLSEDWQLFGPLGGYLSTIALRAAARRSELPRIAAYSCSYLQVPRCEAVRLEVSPLHRSGRSENLRVAMRQGDAHVLDASVWMVGELDGGFEHDHAEAPVVADPESLRSFNEFRKIEGFPSLPLYERLDQRPNDWNSRSNWTQRQPETKTWARFVPRATFEDTSVDAGRSLVLIDYLPFFAALMAHHYTEPYFAVSLDLSVSFHRQIPDSDWLLCFARADVAAGGLIGCEARVFARDRRLVASGRSQMMARRYGS